VVEHGKRGGRRQRDNRLFRFGPWLAAVTIGSACGGSSSSSAPLPAEDDSCAGPCPASNIKHLVVIIQENHTFDDHFGAYCTAAPGSNPSCNDGPSCCEAMPATDPAGTTPTVLNDSTLAGYDPAHDAACESVEIDDGKMDMFATAPAEGGSACGNPGNVAAVDPGIFRPIWDLASTGALGDRYFQPVVGESYSNDMYLARAQYVFADDEDAPLGAVGVTCGVEGPDEVELSGTTIGDLLTAASVPWTFFAEGYTAMQQADPGCPPKPADCAFPLPFDPCGFEPSDVPFEYYASTRDNPATMQDLSAFEADLAQGGLPAVSFVKPLEYKTEHPGQGVTLSAGVTFLTGIVQAILSSRYRGDTLVLVTYDEGGGYFDHVAPPPASTVDGKSYGTRIPLLALGPFAKPGYVSHVVSEHSSIVKLIEWNFLGQQTGQLAGRDAVVANLGDLLDPTATGTAVPQ
jgi:phospholipase C